MEVRFTPYGTAAAHRLRAELSAHKADDPLAPATILVPTNYVGVSIRRQLASGALGPVTAAGPGMTGVDLLTIYRLAELIGAPSLAAEGRRPVNNPVVAAAIRQVLQAEPGVFGGVAEHPATERALVRVHRELRDLQPAQLDRLAADSHRARDVVRVHRATAELLASEWYDEFDLLRAASDITRRNPTRLPQLGHLMLYLPQDLRQGHTALITSLAAQFPTTCIVGTTGVPRADASTQVMLERLGAPSVPAAEAATPVPIAGHISSVSDADEEVRSVVRRIVDDLRDGVRLDRIGVLYASDEPYRRLLDEQLRAAQLPRNGDAASTLLGSTVGRSALGLLALSDHGFRRTELFSLLASAPIRRRADEPALTPLAAWERIARRAGVVEGVDQWRTRLRQLVRDHTADLEHLSATEPDHPRVGQHRRDLQHTSELIEFFDELVAAVGQDPGRQSWADHVGWLRRLLDRYLGPRDDELWPEAERLAGDQLERSLDRLLTLDAIEPITNVTVFRRTLELELDTGLGRVGQLGEGVFVGRVAQSLGLEFDRLYVLGMAEGSFPAPPRDDSLLPDHERALVDGALPLRAGDVDEQHRFFLAALSSTVEPAHLLFPRGDLRRSAERVPSRWLLDTASALDGQRVDGARLTIAARAAEVEWADEVASHLSGIRSVAFPPHQHEYDLATLLRAGDDPEALAQHHLHTTSPAFERGLALTMARASRSFTRFDGNLTDIATPEGTRADVVSPTRLEEWASCPHRYFMSNVLGVRVIEDPERLLRISPLDRGNLMHDALDRFVRESQAAGTLPGPGEDFDADAHERLEKIATELADQVEGRGLVGKDIFWERDRRDILSDLDQLLRRDHRREIRGEVIGSEVGFGVAGAKVGPVEHVLDDGKRVRFRGSIDRLERQPDGSLVVIDYKTGGTSSYRGLSQDDPLARGTRLQLPAYALAARHVVRDPNAAVHAAYWFITEGRGEFRWIGVTVDDQVLQSFDAVVGIIVDGIERGLFVPRPKERDNPAFIECPYCDPDGLGTSELRTQWNRKRHAPVLGAYLALAEPEALLDA